MVPIPAHDDAGGAPPAHPVETTSDDPKLSSGGADEADVAGGACPDGPQPPQKMETVDGGGTVLGNVAAADMPQNGSKRKAKSCENFPEKKSRTDLAVVKPVVVDLAGVNPGVVDSSGVNPVDSDETESEDEFEYDGTHLRLNKLLDDLSRLQDEYKKSSGNVILRDKYARKLVELYGNAVFEDIRPPIACMIDALLLDYDVERTITADHVMQALMSTTSSSCGEAYVICINAAMINSCAGKLAGHVYSTRDIVKEARDALATH